MTNEEARNVGISRTTLWYLKKRINVRLKKKTVRKVLIITSINMIHVKGYP